MFTARSRSGWAARLLSLLLATCALALAGALAGVSADGAILGAAAGARARETAAGAHARETAAGTRVRKRASRAHACARSDRGRRCRRDRPSTRRSVRRASHGRVRRAARRASAHLSSAARKQAPQLSVSGHTLQWTRVAGVERYVVRRVTRRGRRRTEVTGTSTTPVVAPAQTVTYSVRTDVPESQWSDEQSITYPQSPAPSEHELEGEAPASEGEQPAGEPTFAHKIIGTNDGAGWGPAAAQAVISAHITWNRVEIGSQDNPISASEADGFHDLAIVGNVEDETPLSAVEPSAWASTVVSQLRENPNVAIAEAGNEMFLKGGVANPVQYGRMYLAAVQAMQAAGIHTPLLFNMFGDYQRPDGTWSIDSEGGGWLRDAVDAVPGLAGAIAANGLSMHPYGALEENSADDYGVRAVAAEEQVAKAVLGSIPPVYITEFGFDLGRCGQVDGACSQEEQASKLKAAYEVFLADPHVAGIWAYQTHDDGTGQWGYMNDDNSPRPAFGVLSAFAVAQGQ